MCLVGVAVEAPCGRSVDRQVGPPCEIVVLTGLFKVRGTPFLRAADYHVHKASKLIDVSVADDEGEIILAPGTRFRVQSIDTGVDWNAEARTVVRLQVEEP